MLLLCAPKYTTRVRRAVTKDRSSSPRAEQKLIMYQSHNNTQLHPHIHLCVLKSLIRPSIISGIILLLFLLFAYPVPAPASFLQHMMCYNVLSCSLWKFTHSFYYLHLLWWYANSYHVLKILFFLFYSTKGISMIWHSHWICFMFPIIISFSFVCFFFWQFCLQ